MIDIKADSTVPRPFGNNANTAETKKHYGLKADAVPANGGIGVSYSSLVLGGQPTQPAYTEYRNSYETKGKLRNHSPNNTVSNNYSHKTRFISAQQHNVQSQNQLSYVKGVDFNSQNKYDFDILNNQPRGSVGSLSALREAGVRSVLRWEIRELNYWLISQN